jgi:RHH-type transcriptional regulator, rel operon repressor / antitoxin RelB
MARETVTVRLDPATRRNLDEIASVLERDRSHVINAAIAAYIDVHQWQIDHIRQGLREADAGKFAPDTEVRRTIQKLRAK